MYLLNNKYEIFLRYSSNSIRIIMWHKLLNLSCSSTYQCISVRCAYSSSQLFPYLFLFCYYFDYFDLLLTFFLCWTPHKACGQQIGWKQSTVGWNWSKPSGNNKFFNSPLLLTVTWESIVCVCVFVCRCVSIQLKVKVGVVQLVSVRFCVWFFF